MICKKSSSYESIVFNLSCLPFGLPHTPKQHEVGGFAVYENKRHSFV
jgi:hypothetical protein